MGDPEDARRQREKANREHLQRKSKASSRTAARKAAKENLPPVVGMVDGPVRLNTNGKRARTREDADEDDEDTPSGLHPDDPGNFLKLCQVLRILTSRKITDDQINQADQLLRSYCLELIKVSFFGHLCSCLI
jgi:hypothetical protein